MKVSNLSICFACLTFLVLTDCSNNDEDSPAPIPKSQGKFIIDLEVVQNPSRVAPLTAKIFFSSSQEARVRIRVGGRNGEASDVIHEFPEVGTSFEIPVLGLYAGGSNQVEITLLTTSGDVLEVRSIDIVTDPLVSDLPEIRLDVPETGLVAPSFTLVNYFGYVRSFLPQRAFMFDQFGDIRWYLNFEGHAQLPRLFYDNGMMRLQNNNLISGDRSTGGLYEFNMLGEIVGKWPIQLQGYGFHHHVIEKSNGNFLVTVNDYSKTTEEDVVIEVDRTSGAVVKKWDLSLSLDPNRKAWPNVLTDGEIDWFHANGLAYSESDKALIVSGAYQGVVKLTDNNEVTWILAPHKDWGTTAEGVDLNQFLLQPLDAAGDHIDDEDVLVGNLNHPDFEWPWYQHSPVLMPNGNILVFDNGDNRNYAGESDQSYSRAVEYEIDEANRTIRQVWTYGRDRGVETYSRIVSKVAYLTKSDRIIFAPGAVNFQGQSYGKIIEIDRQDGKLQSEATIVPPGTTFNMTFHGVHRMSLYGDQ